ncbi:MAG: ornithine cyclodeaminase family protein [Bacteroidia bacterium]|nr:ornithine cyclodeaminase family protein [Bacteroidia bacterium]
MPFLSKKDIEKCVTMPEVIDAVKQAFSMAEKGLIDVPLRTVIPTGTGSLLFMPAYSEVLGLAVLKNVNVIPGNVALGLSTTPAGILLIDAKTGYTLAMLDGTYVTKLRTGAASGAAFDILARKHCRKGALIGTGGQAESQLDAMLSVRDLEEVSIFSRTPERCKMFVDRMCLKYASSGVTLKCADNSDECIEEADLIITATTAEEPVFDGTKVKRGATISCVGTYEPQKHEIDPELLVRADKIFCDSKNASLSESGDLLIPIRQGLLSGNDILGGLGEVINGTLQGRENDDEIIVFETVGIAAQDLITSGLIFEKAKHLLALCPAHR